MEIIQKYFDDFTPKQIQQFTLLKDLYIDWNDKINVISRKDINEIYLHHVLHSLSIAAIANFSSKTQIIDIGCGGGFPGIPLAIFFPEAQFHLVDSIGKKLKVVDAISKAIGLDNVTIQHSRVEEIKNRKFDFAISRAVAPLKTLWHWSNPLLNKITKPEQTIKNGLICLKGGDLHQEIYESQTKPSMMDIYSIFKEEYFKEKFILYVKK